MDNLIRTDTVFGKRVNIVGNISADLVLESLGKIYIKSRNKSQTLEEVIKSLAIEDPNVSTSKCKVVERIEGLDTTEFREGTFVFDKLSNILYLFIDDELLELINVAPEDTGYVKRSGDTMTGRLAIYVKDGPPLYVNSSTLIKNLNAQYLNGETSDSFTRRNKDEKINGAWTFRKPTTFESSSLFYKDIITYGSIGTPEFSSGFGGYGWRMDADTNTLTIDNLIVRKLMQVYELVVNKISATNGSLWITNAGKVTSVQKLEIKESSFFSTSDEYEKFCLTRHQNEFFIRLFNPINYKSFSDPVAAFSTASGDGVFIKQCWNNESLRNAKVVKTLLDTSYTGQYFDNTSAENYRIYDLFSSEFVFDCTFPIITRNNYTRYLQDKELGNVNVASYISVIYSYFKYFAGGDYYVVTFDDDGFPVFKPGDILRCQKWTHDGIKYYDAVICNVIGKQFIIQLAGSILDKKTTITYDSSLNAQVTYGEDEINLGLYQQSSHYKEPSEDPNENINYDENGNTIRLSYQNQQEKDLIGLVEEKDSLVQIGNLWDPQRQNAVYITSTDNGAPFMDVISGVNRPDYSVIYYVPIYQTIKLHTTATVNKNTFIGFNRLVDIPYTGDYYIQKDGTKCEYVYFKYNNKYYLATGSTVPSIPGESVDILYYLSTIPNENTRFGAASESFFFLTESGEKIITEGFENGQSVPEKCIVLEEELSLLQIASTRTTKARLGNLDGIQDEIFPIDKQPYGYGLYGQNVFLTGEFYLSNGRSLADIGNDAITFAIAAQNSFYNSLNVLKEDLHKANDLLSQSVYSKGELRTAGMKIGNDANGNPGILLWGNHVIIATTENEFAGIDRPTALFADGKIQAKFLSVDQARCTVDANVGQTEFTVTSGNPPEGTTYTSVGIVRIYKDTNNVYYVRKFQRSSDNKYIWLKVNPDGYPISKVNGQYNPEGITFVYQENTDNSETFTNGLFYIEGTYSTDVEDAFTACTEPLKVWGLEVDGKGNLGGPTLYWNQTGKVVVNGILYSTEGKIGGLNIGTDAMFTNNTTYNYNPLIISSTGYGYRENEQILPYIQLQSDVSGTIKYRSIMTSRGVFQLINTNSNISNPSWSNFATISSPGIIFNLTIIPVLDSNGVPTLYVRHFCNLSCFEYGNLSWQQGYYALHFPLIDSVSDSNRPYYHEANWFIEQLFRGNISFQITGHNVAHCNYNYSDTIMPRNADKIPDYQSLKKYFTFNLEYMLDNPAIEFKMYSNNDKQWGDKIKAAVDQICFKGDPYKLNTDSLVDTHGEGTDFSTSYRYGCKFVALCDNSILEKYNTGGIYSWGSSQNVFDGEHFTNNTILITTSDDNTVNWGGFTLTCQYHPVFDNRYITTQYYLDETIPEQ